MYVDMEIQITITHTYDKDTCIYMICPKDVLYIESVGVGFTPEEAIYDFIESFNSMTYIENHSPIFISNEDLRMIGNHE